MYIFINNRVACLCTAVLFIASFALWARESSVRKLVANVVRSLTVELVVVVIRERMC